MIHKIFLYSEQCRQLPLKDEESKILLNSKYEQFFPVSQYDREKRHCYLIEKRADESKSFFIDTSYFIGLDWIDRENSAICVAPKLNTESKETDYIKMLFSCVDDPAVSEHINDLLQIKWKEPFISIEKKQDLLTPFLVVQYLVVMKSIVRKGLKKSYYRVEKNLKSRVKGKVLVSKTIKHNIVQNKQLQTWCTYEEFGVNNVENRLLKKALIFVMKYLPQYVHHLNIPDVQNTFNYISPAFREVSENISLNEIKHTKTNVFYKEYTSAIRIAKYILRRFGYNISNVEKDFVETPPFWIDMSKLFELYVLRLLRKRFANDVKYHFTTPGNELDYLLASGEYKMVVDAKYIPAWRNGINHENIRQVSGYARLKKVYTELYNDNNYDNVIEGVIIYPDDDGVPDLSDVNFREHEIDGYYGIYKVGIKLPPI